MMSRRVDERQLRRALEIAYADEAATADYRTRIATLVNGELESDRPPSIQPLRSEPPAAWTATRRWLPAAAAVVAVTGLVVGTVLFGPGTASKSPAITAGLSSSSATAPTSAAVSPSVATPASVQPSTASLRCGHPSGSFATYWLGVNNAADWYTGTVTVDGTRVPSLSMYFSDGAPGEGVLCASAPRQNGGLWAVLTPSDAPIAYLGVDQWNQVWGAVRPGVDRVVIDDLGELVTLTVATPDSYRLQPLGDGWHAFSMGRPPARAVGQPTTKVPVYAYTNGRSDPVQVSSVTIGPTLGEHDLMISSASSTH